ncbi:cobalt transporter CbiM [Pelosinus sp. sgz500959]|uniref:cobalt transporter CbiM n=1 Tax=Pelosinus sp. sgz500959 TaxID=3242472 RepID=UPI00366AFE09
MHIPDGYLSPSTCLTLGGVMLPVWYRASAVVKKHLELAQIPFMAMGAVFAFLIMMFNVPIPDGTTAHAVGGVLIAIALGPWAAVIAVSVALFIQALVFGDGGMLAFGANAFNMAFIMPFSGYYTYKLLVGKGRSGSTRSIIAAGVSGYVGINLAALVAAIEFGIQPLLFLAADGTPLYSPYGLGVSIPAMMSVHLLIAGFIEGTVTALVLKFAWKTSPELVRQVKEIAVGGE